MIQTKIFIQQEMNSITFPTKPAHYHHYHYTFESSDATGQSVPSG
jgi:hypothetical protein